MCCATIPVLAEGWSGRAELLYRYCGGGMSLTDIGFSTLAEQIYLTLFDHSDADPERLAELLGRSAVEVDIGTAELLALGVVRRPDPDGPLSLQHPAAALGELIERREDDLLREHRSLGEARSMAADLAVRFDHGLGTAGVETSGEPVDRWLARQHLVERITDPERVPRRLAELTFLARTSVYSVQPGGAISRSALDMGRTVDLRGLRRGLDIRAIYAPAFYDDPVGGAFLREMSDAGALVRVSHGELERMVIVDERLAVVPVDPTDSARGALVIRAPVLLTGMVRLFTELWRSATEVPTTNNPAPPQPEPLAEEDRRVIALLASGTTDETAARVIGVSVRHLRRRVARLMERLGASSRFEAGVAAARRGWI